MSSKPFLYSLLMLFFALAIPFAFSDYFTESNPLADTDWTMFGRDLNHSRFSSQIYNLATRFRPIATFSIGNDIESSPAVFNGSVYIGSIDNNLYRLNASNISQQLGVFTAGGYIVSSPAVSNGFVYIGSFDGSLYQLNISNFPQQIAAFGTGSQIEGSPAISGGFAYIGSNDHRVYQLNASNISEQIANFTTGDIIEGSPAVSGGYLYVGSYDDLLYQLNASNISEQIANFTTGYNIYASPAVANSYLYAANDGGLVVQLNASNISEQIANFTVSNWGTSPAVSADFVYVGSRSNCIYQFNASNISEQIANFTAGGEVHSSPAISSGVLYAGSLDGRIYALNASNISQQIANYSAGSIFSSPAVSNGIIYFGSYDGNVYSLTLSADVDLDKDGFNATIDCNDDDYNIVPPFNNYSINRSVTFCPGTYNLLNGMNITASNIVVQCNRTLINGTDLYEGIESQDNVNITIKECNISNYNFNIYLFDTNSSRITNNTATDSANEGIYLEGSYGNVLTSNTVKDNAGKGFIISSSPNTTMTSNTAIDNAYGIFLFLSPNSTLTSNTLNSDSYGIYLSTASDSVITSNTANDNTERGIYISSSSNDNLVMSNTFNGNNYGVYMSSSSDNNLTYNVITKNKKGIELLSSSSNIFEHNLIHHNLQESAMSEILSPDRIYQKNQMINATFNITYINGTAYSDYNYIISLYPDTNYTVTTYQNNISLNFTPEKEGIYTISVNITSPTGNEEVQNYVLRVGNISYGESTYYLHQDKPVHAQPASPIFDSGSMFSYNTSSDNDGEVQEIRYCTSWIQYSPDEIINNFFLIKNVSWGLYYNISGTPVVRLQEYAVYFFNGDYSNPINATGGLFKFNTTNFTSVNLASDYSWKFYWLALKLTGANGNLAIISNGTYQSYANFTYAYAGPNIVEFKAANNDTDIRNVRMLSSYFENDAKDNATIQIDGAGNITVAVNMTILGNYTVKYDGIACSANPGCSLNANSRDFINVTLALGSMHNLTVENNKPTIVFAGPNETNETESVSADQINFTTIVHANRSVSYNTTVEDIDADSVTFEWFVDGVSKFIEAIVRGVSNFFSSIFSWQINDTAVHNITFVVNDSYSNDTFTFIVNSTCTDYDGDSFSPEGGFCGVVDCNDNDNLTYPPADNAQISSSVTFCNGTYYLDSGVDIIASNIVVQCNNTVLNGPDTTGPYGITGSKKLNVTISNCNITEYQRGISLSDFNDSNIVNNSLYDNDFQGLYLSACRNLSVSDNYFFRNNAANVLASVGQDIVFDKNTFSQGKVGISFSGAIAAVVKNNFIEHMTTIFDTVSTSNISFFNNTFENSKALSSGSMSGSYSVTNTIKDLINPVHFNKTLSNEGINSSYETNSRISFNISMQAANGSVCPSFSYAITVYPEQNYTISQSSANLDIAFTPSKSGIHSVTLNTTCHVSNDSEINRLVFQVGDKTIGNIQQYLRGAYNEELFYISNDVGYFSYSPPTTEETRTCAAWVLYSFSETKIPFLNINNFTVTYWSNFTLFGAAGIGNYTGFDKQFYASLSTDHKIVVPEFHAYTENTVRFTDLNFSYAYLWEPVYTGFMLAGNQPYLLSSPAKLSTANITYTYTGPHITEFKSANNGTDIRNVQLLSSYFENVAKDNATIQIDGDGNITIAVNMTRYGNYSVRYDDVLCSANPNCTLNYGSTDFINVTVELGSVHALNIANITHVVASSAAVTTAATSTTHRSYTSTCTANFECGEWSSCIDSKQTRTCTDKSRCYKSRTEERACAAGQQVTEQPESVQEETIAPQNNIKELNIVDLTEEARTLSLALFVLITVVLLFAMVDRMRSPLFRFRNHYDVKSTFGILRKAKNALSKDKNLAVHAYNNAVRAYQALSEEKKGALKKEFKNMHRKIMQKRER